MRRVAEKAEENGYVAIDDGGFEFAVSLTAKGAEVLRKRFAVENHAADAVLAGLTPDEVDQLVALADKISATCKDDLGIDYARIEKRSCRHGHGHDAPQYVFVFGDDGRHGRGKGKKHGCC